MEKSIKHLELNDEKILLILLSLIVVGCSQEKLAVDTTDPYAYYGLKRLRA